MPSVWGAAYSSGDNMSKQPKVEVLVRGSPVEFTFHALKNGGASIGLKQAALDTKASKAAKAAKTTKPTAKVTDGVRFDGTQAIIRIDGEDVATVDKPKGGQKAYKRAINSELWNGQGGSDNADVWAHRVKYSDLPK